MRMLPTIAVMIPIKELHRCSSDLPSLKNQIGSNDDEAGIDVESGAARTDVIASSVVEVEKYMSAVDRVEGRASHSRCPVGQLLELKSYPYPMILAWAYVCDFCSTSLS
jgi:hypothetical protein